MKINGLYLLGIVLLVAAMVITVFWIKSAQERVGLTTTVGEEDLYLDRDLEEAILSTEKEIDTASLGDAVYVDKIMFNYGEPAGDNLWKYSGVIFIVNEQTIGIKDAKISIEIRTSLETERLTLITDEFGKVEFDVEVENGSGEWFVEIVDILGDGLHYAPELNNIRVYNGINQ
ncbi:MAG: hypothetical protein ABH826_04155 [Patescibacteria group bacterium]